jgi:hypothetical protein
VGKVFKPALRLGATKRRVATLLADLVPAEATLDEGVQAHAVHGNAITLRVSVTGVATAQRAALEDQLHKRMNPFVMRQKSSGPDVSQSALAMLLGEIQSVSICEFVVVMGNEFICGI